MKEKVQMFDKYILHHFFATYSFYFIITLPFVCHTHLHLMTKIHTCFAYYYANSILQRK